MKSKQPDIVIHVRFSREQVKAMHSRAKKETGGNVSELVRRQMFPRKDEVVRIFTAEDERDKLAEEIKYSEKLAFDEVREAERIAERAEHRARYGSDL